MCRMIATWLGRVARCFVEPSFRRTAVRYKASLGISGTQVEHERGLKTIDDLHGPSQLELLYWVFLRGYLFQIHKLEVKQKNKYGPMWKSKLGRYHMVNIASPAIMENLLKEEGKYPMRSDMLLWKEHRDLRGHLYGPVSEQGHRWQMLRSVLNQKMLKPHDAARYTEALHGIVPDLLNRIKELRAESPSGLVVKDVARLLYTFAFESISTVIFETRLGCLERQIPEETQKFINAIGIMMESEMVIEKLPRWTRSWLPFWGRFIDAWDTIYAYSSKLIDKKMSDIEGRLQRGDDLGGAYLTHMLTSGKLDVKDVYGVMPEILQAGVDTTSHTLTWALNLLAKHPAIQRSLYEEVMNVIPDDRVPSTEDISKMQLLKAVIKETLRVYPVIAQNARITVDNEVVLEGYHFPKNTLFILSHYVMSRDEANFPEPDRFLPQRWLRSVGRKHNPYSSIPFGFGVRGCLGRRVAELEMYFALSKIIKKFQVVPDPEMGDVHSKMRVILVASRPVALQFIDRPISVQIDILVNNYEIKGQLPPKV